MGTFANLKKLGKPPLWRVLYDLSAQSVMSAEKTDEYRFIENTDLGVIDGDVIAIYTRANTARGAERIAVRRGGEALGLREVISDAA